MNVSELARRVRTHPKVLLEVLPKHGFDIGAKAVKIDDRVAETIIRRWKHIQRAMEDDRQRAVELQKQKDKEARREAGQMVELPHIVTVREFAERLGLPITQVIMELMKNGILANQNQNIDFDTATIMAEEMGFRVEKLADNKEKVIDEDRTAQLENALSRGENKTTRSPVVVVMGHVDHGKTTLLDAIRQTNIIKTESGGITQHIGAYQTIWKDPKTKAERAITFIDTPGHEAFTVMRSRGAKVADIAILVVAADDGVKPQTEEVIQIIRAAKLPIVVAINKIDKEGADLQRVKTELSHRNIIPEEWGGDVPVVEISAKGKKHIDKLLDVLLLVADMHPEELSADQTIPAVGTVIDSRVDKGMGPVATVLVQAGTLHKGDALVVNREIYGKVRAMKNDRGREIDSAGPSVPVQIIGFKTTPRVGDVLDVSEESIATPVDLKQKRAQQTGAEQSSVAAREEDEEKPKKLLNVIVKADVLGSLEAILGSLDTIRHDEVGVKVVGKGLGNIMDDDIKKAEATGAIMLGFHAGPSNALAVTIRDKGVAFHRFDVIYDLLNFVKDELEKMLESEKIVTELGNLKVMGIFRTDKAAMTIGGRVESGKVKKDCIARVKRDDEIVGEGKITSCQIAQQVMKEVPGGSECGLRFEGKIKIEVGDVLEFYTVETKIRKIVFEKPQ